jgi:TldD protein
MNSIHRPADLGSFASQLADYTELRVQENRNIQIALVNGDVVGNVRAARSGVSARSCAGGLWGFSSAPTASNESIERTLQLARKNAELLAAREKREGAGLPTTVIEGEHDYGTRQERRSQKELIEFLRELDAHVVKTCPDLSSRTLMIACLDMEKTLLTSTGSSAHSLTPRALVYVEMTVMSDGAPISLMKSYGGLGHFEDRFADPKDLHAELADQYEHTLKKGRGHLRRRRRQAVHPRGGPGRHPGARGDRTHDRGRLRARWLGGAALPRPDGGVAVGHARRLCAYGARRDLPRARARR